MRTAPTTGAHHSRPSMATYRRRRVAVTAAVVTAITVMGLGTHGVLTGPGGVPASAAGTGMAPPVVHVRAEAGDSLWSLAERHRGEVGVRRYVEALIDLNGGTDIEVGQLVRLP